MEKLIEAVKSEIDNEYARASEKNGLVNNSDHQSYGVILEEFEEMIEETHFMAEALNEFWTLAKDKCAQDSDKVVALDRLQTHAMLAACEAIQVAAMAHKAKLTIQQGLVE